MVPEGSTEYFRRVCTIKSDCDSILWNAVYKSNTFLYQDFELIILNRTLN